MRGNLFIIWPVIVVFFNRRIKKDLMVIDNG